MQIELISITPEPEKVIELAARTCYQSQAQAEHEHTGVLIGKLLAMGHETPLEHAYATFRITGCSRAMSHQLVRHRLMAVCQKSQRYVAEEDFEYVVPPSLGEADRAEFARDMATIGRMYAKWKARGVRKEDARFVLPNACATELVISANFREFRHIFAMRCSPHAQWEIRSACTDMLKQLHAHAPDVFADLLANLDDQA
jgi:thymidylate synthase (FAD)